MALFHSAGTAAAAPPQPQSKSAPAEAAASRTKEAAKPRTNAAGQQGVRPDVVKGLRRKRIEPGVLFLNQETEPGLAQAERKGVLNISLDDGVQVHSNSLRETLAALLLA